LKEFVIGEKHIYILFMGNWYPLEWASTKITKGA